MFAFSRVLLFCLRYSLFLSQPCLLKVEKFSCADGGLFVVQDIDVHAKVPKLHVKVKPDVVKVCKSGELVICITSSRRDSVFYALPMVET